MLLLGVLVLIVVVVLVNAVLQAPTAPTVKPA